MIAQIFKDIPHEIKQLPAKTVLPVDSDKIADIEVEELLLAGKPYESAVTPLGKCIWNGLFSKNRY